MATIKPKRGSGAPSTGLTEYELAVDTTNKRIYIGNAGGSGDLIGSAPGGSDTQVQFNDGGVMGGDSGLTYNKTTDTLTVTGDLAVNGGDITSTASTVALLDGASITNATAFRSATTLTFGATTGTTLVRNNLTTTLDLAVNGGDITTSATTATVFNTTVTNLSVGGAATTLTMGATSGTAAIRNATLTLGNTASSVVTNSGSTNHITISPYGEVILAPTTGILFQGSIPSITVENTDGATGVVEIAGGDLFLARKTADDATFTPVNIIFEGATNNTNETTLTVEDPTADRTITLPDAGGTVGVMASPTNQQIQFYDSGTKNLKGDADLIFDGTNLQIGSQGDLRLADSDSSNYVAFQAPATVSNNNIYTLPSAVGSANQVLQIASVAGNDATLQWATVSGSGSPGGSDTYVQFNDGSTFGGDAGFTYNKTTDSVTLAGDIAVNGGDITTTTTGSASLYNNNATTINVGTAAATTVNLGTNANGAVINLCNGNISFSRTGSGMLFYSNLTDGSANGMNIKCNTSGSPIQIGDVDGVGNSTILTVNDSAGTITFDTGTGLYTFPTTNGSNGQVLTTNGSGTLSWASASAGAAGSNTQVQFNDGGTSLGGDSGLTYNKTTDSLTVGGRLTAQTVVSTSTTQTVDFSVNINQIQLTIYGLGVDFNTSLQNIEKYGIENTPVTIDTGTASYISCELESIESFYDDTNGWSARLVIKPPFVGGTSTTAEGVIAETINAVYIQTPTVPLEYWTSITNINLYHKPETYVVKTVTGQSWVASDSCISCRLLGGTSTDHDVEDAVLEEVKFEINNLVVGTGFDIIGYAPNGTYGKYTVKCFAQ
jgi:hypothetical protein